MLGPLARATQKFSRNVIQVPVRNGSSGGIPGENLPFNIHNRARITINFFLFVATGVGAPFIILLHQLRKK